MSALVDYLPIGVVVVDDRGRVVHVNAYERRVAGAHAADAVGRPFFTEVAPCFEIRGLAAAFRRGMQEASVKLQTELSFRFAHLPKPREVRLTIDSFFLGSDLLAVACLQDISDFREHERVRDLVAATTIHDLKTPLAVAAMEIDATLSMIGDPKLHQPLLAARASVDRAARLATTMLDVRSIARGDRQSLLIDVDLVLLASATLKTLRLLADAQDVTLELDGDDVVPLRCDASLVRRALENLLDNAIRHVPERSTVTMRITRTNEGARASVIDHGAGIPQERRSQVFELDHPSSGERSWNFGLGLTLVALVAQKHGGGAWVEETAGGGATFVLDLPSATTSDDER